MTIAFSLMVLYGMMVLLNLVRIINMPLSGLLEGDGIFITRAFGRKLL